MHRPSEASWSQYTGRSLERARDAAERLADLGIELGAYRIEHALGGRLLLGAPFNDQSTRAGGVHAVRVPRRPR
jgi:hypothetical protein